MALSGVLPKPWMIITQFYCGIALIILGALRLRSESSVGDGLGIKQTASQPAPPSLSASVIREVLREFPTSTNPRFDWEEHFQKVADRLNTILDAAKPAEQGPCKNCGFDEFVHQVPCVTWEQRESELRDIVLDGVIEMLLPYEEEGKPCKANLCATCTIARVRALKSQVSVTGASHEQT